MDFEVEWDAAKNERNLEKHGFDFTDAAECFRHPLLVHEDTRQDYGEHQWVALWCMDETLVNCVFARHRTRIRIILLRTANRRERKIYEQFFPQAQSHGLDAHSPDDGHGH